MGVGLSKKQCFTWTRARNCVEKCILLLLGVMVSCGLGLMVVYWELWWCNERLLAGMVGILRVFEDVWVQ